MTLQVVPSMSAQLSSDGGFCFDANCPGCGGGFTVEGSSRGREDVAFPQREVRTSLFCAHCKDRYVLEVRLGIATRQRAPERRWNK